MPAKNFPGYLDGWVLDIFPLKFPCPESTCSLSLLPHCPFFSSNNRTPVSFKDDRTGVVALYSEVEPHVTDASAAPQTLCHQVREE